MTGTALSGRNQVCQGSRATPLVPSPVDQDGAARHPYPISYPISEFGLNPDWRTNAANSTGAGAFGRAKQPAKTLTFYNLKKGLKAPEPSPEKCQFAIVTVGETMR